MSNPYELAGYIVQEGRVYKVYDKCGVPNEMKYIDIGRHKVVYEEKTDGPLVSEEYIKEHYPEYLV